MPSPPAAQPAAAGTAALAASEHAPDT